MRHSVYEIIKENKQMLEQLQKQLQDAYDNHDMYDYPEGIVLLHIINEVLEL